MIPQYISPHLEMAGIEVRHGLTFVEVRSLADLSLWAHSQGFFTSQFSKTRFLIPKVGR
jgi:hypothetical protein